MKGMYMNKFIFILCISFWFSPIIWGQNIHNIPFNLRHQFKISQLTSKDGLSQNSIRAIIQDQQGFIWFGTNDGLNRYDGKNFKTYTHIPNDSTTLSGSNINHIYETKKGILWIGGHSRGINRFDPQTGKFKQFLHKKDVPNTLSDNRIRGIAEDQWGNIWVGTQNGLNKITPNKNTIERIFPKEGQQGGLSNSAITGVYQDKKGNLWISTSDKLNLLQTSKSQTITFKHYPTNIDNTAKKSIKNITVFYEDKQERLWVGASWHAGANPHIIGTLDRNTGKVTTYKFLSGSRIRTIYQDSNNIVWVGTNVGLYWFNEKSKQFVHFKTDVIQVKDIYSADILDMLEDRSGNLWLGASGRGVYIIDTKSRKFASHKVFLDQDTDKLNVLSPWQMVADGNDLWMCSQENRLVLYNTKTNKLTQFRHETTNPNSLSNDLVTFVYKDTKSRIWISTRKGLNLLNKHTKEFKRYVLEGTKAVPLHVFEDTQGNIFTQLTSEWIYKLNPTTDALEKYIKLPPIRKRKNRVNMIWIDESGIFWIGTINGLLIFDPKTKKDTIYGKTAGSENSVLQVYKDKLGQVWLATYGGGLKKVIKEKDGQINFQSYGKQEGLLNEYIYGIQEDTQGNLWMSHEKGITRFDLKKEIFTNYTVLAGVVDGEFNQDSHAQNEQGQIFFGSSQGINAFYPEKVKSNDFLPPIRLIDFQAAHQASDTLEAPPFKGPIRYTKKIVLTYEQAKTFSFEFVALSYVNAENNQYKAKLEGYDKNWRYLGTRNFVSYTNIPPNTYTFRVQGSNNDGVWNTKGLRVEIVILPAWWQTWWFRVSWIAAIVLLVIGIYKVRLASIKRQKNVLEQKIVERTKEVVKQKEEIASQYDAINAQNEELQQHQEEIMAQRDAIEEKNELLHHQNDQIRQSMNAAKTIQEAILPFEERMNQILGQYFIIYRPRDIVSGDFYWLGEVKGKRIVGVLDCTGHGIPGAFMSMIGVSLINEIITAKQIVDPAEILEQLRCYIRHALNQDKTGRRNGMDAAFVTLETTEDEQIKVIFAGAKRPLWYIEKDSTEIQEIEGSSISVGIIYENKRTVTSQSFVFDKGTLLYLCTDGLSDQNDRDRKKLGNWRLKELIFENSELPLTKQKQALNKILDQHMTDTEQRDDILFMGIRL